MTGLFNRVKTRINLFRHRNRPNRRLEIGPGDHALPGFETLNICGGRWVNYICDAAGELPFDDGTFELIYASHILEHIPWYRVGQTLREWVRVLRPGGSLEVWVPNGLKICRAFVDAERGDPRGMQADGWFRFNPAHDPCLWAAGRLFTYGDGKGDLASPNWHRALFSPRYLEQLLEEAGLQDVRTMGDDEVRGAGHGWINLGMTGTRPAAAPCTPIPAEPHTMRHAA